MALTCEELVQRALDALDEEDFDEAEACGRRALMVDPSSIDARIGLARALTNKEQHLAALDLLEEAVRLAPDDSEVRIEIGITQFENCRFEPARKNLERAIELGASCPEADYWMALSLERRGDFLGADEFFERAHGIDPTGYPAPKRTTRHEFVAAVEEARSRLPKEFDRHLENVAIRIEDLPEEEILSDSEPPLDPCILGLFVGVPLTEKSALDPTPRMPDSVFLFKRNIERSSEDWDDLVDEIQTTLFHEIGHYMGYDDDDLAERGWA